MRLCLLLAGACAGDRATAFETAMSSGRCAELEWPELRDDCAVFHRQCALVEGEKAGWECAFRQAEHEGDAAACAKAGGWADDCRLHVWAASFERWAPKGVRPGEAEAQVAERLPGFGLELTDPRPWSAWFRFVHGNSRPLDRAACAAVVDPMQAEACRQTALAHYGDMLNVARDRKLYPCDGGPLPAFLQYTPDPEIDALRARRTDLCPP